MTCAKSQVLADLLVELRKEGPEVTTSGGTWILIVDGASSKQGPEVGMHLTSPPQINNRSDYTSLPQKTKSSMKRSC